MKKIPLTQGKFAMVDDSDFESVVKFKWCVHNQKVRAYAMRGVTENGKTSMLYLHRFLMPGVVSIDHIDGNGLNCQRHNLRPASDRQNARGFRNKRDGATSRYRGVCWVKRDQRWLAQIRTESKTIYLGNFKSEIEAARAYDSAARKYFGDFASPNFP